MPLQAQGLDQQQSLVKCTNRGVAASKEKANGENGKKAGGEGEHKRNNNRGGSG